MRPTWNETFLEVAHVASRRAACLRAQVGAVLVLDHRIVAVGYNGTPSGAVHCTDGGCPRGLDSSQPRETCTGLHAEMNAVADAARRGVCIQGAVLYVTKEPCSYCVRLLVAAGVERIVCDGQG